MQPDPAALLRRVADSSNVYARGTAALPRTPFGHSQISTTSRYAHSPQVMTAAAGRIGHVLRGKT